MKLRITVEGKTYDVDVEVVPEPGAEAPGNTDEDVAARLEASVGKVRPPTDVLPEDRILRSPIAGTIVTVKVSVGQKVKRDEAVLTIEAMKMISAIGSPMTGTVQSVLIGPGDTVKPGQVLMELA